VHVVYTEVSESNPKEYEKQLAEVYNKDNKGGKSNDPEGLLLGMANPEPTDRVNATRFFKGEMDNGARFLQRLDEKNNCRSEITRLADNISSREEIFLSLAPSLTLKSGTLDKNFYKEMFEAVNNMGRQTGMDITQENIVDFLKSKGAAHPKDDGKKIFEKYTEIYNKMMYTKDTVSGEKFPSNDLFKMAIEQVDRRIQMDSKSPVRILKSFSPAYTEAVMLYCNVKGYPVKNDTTYKNIDDLIDKNRIKKCAAYLERKGTDVGYDSNQVRFRQSLKKELAHIEGETHTYQRK
jgi:hypothetical protein